MLHIEVCANSFRSALAALKGGAHRIELCQNLEQGGTTPSAADIQLAIENLQPRGMEVFVLIRPRPGDFVYSREEMEVMKRDILYCKEQGVNGVVFGVLTPDFEIDLTKMKILTNLAQPMKVTFHRAFDFIKEPFLALEQIIKLGIQRILTSGQEPTAMEGHKMIRSLIEKANNRIVILPGSGIHSKNIQDLKKQTEAKEFHLSAKKRVAGVKGKNGASESDYFVTDWREVAQVIKLVT